MTNDPEIPTTASITDYVARRLALDFVPYGERARLSVLTPAEQTALTAHRAAAADDEAAAPRPRGRGAGHRLTQAYDRQSWSRGRCSNSGRSLVWRGRPARALRTSGPRRPWTGAAPA
ncbi:hypothetical protein GCM10014719_28650 [Planomonospora parontospora subsp. antibiotica]|nr:hypothetical protein GCM10014719_28650 [Planomonospora parontospora subsp. antibiotica]GII16358.1 hypothetical protein Ppa05_30840 [Planomonospora parontospora subsp. antibiotica]